MCIRLRLRVSFMHTYLCARFVRKFGTDHHDDVVGGLFLLHSGAKGNEELSRSTRGTTEASAWFLSCRDFVILTTRTNRYDVWETKR